MTEEIVYQRQLSPRTTVIYYDVFELFELMFIIPGLLKSTF